MKRIYLAISSDEKYIINELKNSDKDRQLEYKSIKKEEIKDIIYLDFFLLIVDQENLTDKELKSLNVGKLLCKIWYVHSKYKNNFTEHITTFTDTDSLIQSIKLNDHVNKSIIETKSKQPIENQEQREEKKEVEMTESPKKQATLEEQVNSDPSTDVYKPLSLDDDYLSIDKGVVNKIKNESEQIESTITAPRKEKGKVIETTQKKISEQLNKDEKEETIQIDPIKKRAAHIRKELFSETKWTQNKTIGVWSPLHRMGTTTFIINFALYLGRMKIPTVVIESLTEYQLIKTVLQRYKSKPENWVSFMEALHDEKIDESHTDWTFERVKWFPLGEGDKDFTWNENIIFEYFNIVKYFDLALVDLPAGEMKSYTLETLNHIEELWVLVDDSVQQVMAWRNYISKIQNEYNIKIKLIFVNTYSFSKAKKLAKDLDLPLFTSIPDLSEQASKNHYMKYPLIDQEGVFDLLQDPFEVLGKHLVGELSTYKKTKKFLSKIRSIF